jgi:hypothetical protein
LLSRVSLTFTRTSSLFSFQNINFDLSLTFRVIQIKRC